MTQEEKLCMYLPHDIFMGYYDSKGELNKPKLTIDNWSYHDGCYVKGEWTKPILFDRDLTALITIDGKEIVPIVELAKIAYPRSKPDKFKVVGNYLNMGLDYSLHFDTKELGFDCKRGFNGHRWDSHCYVPNQFKLLKQLCKWRINLFFEEGEYIGANGINVY